MLILIASFIVGIGITSFTLLSAVICLTFCIPLTKELDRADLLVKNNPIIKHYFRSILFLTIIFFGITFLIYRFGSSIVQIGYVLGFIYVFFKIIFDINQIYINQENVSDYIENNSKYFNKVIKGPMEDVVNFIYIKVFCERLDVVSSNMARTENLSSRIEIKTHSAEIFKDAMRIEPHTPEGKSARLESQKYADQVTQLSKNSWKKI